VGRDTTQTICTMIQKFLKHQVAKEIGLSLASIPFMGMLTTPFLLGEVYGYSRCYDHVPPCSLSLSHTHIPFEQHDQSFMKIYGLDAWMHIKRWRSTACRSFCSPSSPFSCLRTAPSTGSIAACTRGEAIPEIKQKNRKKH